LLAAILPIAVAGACGGDSGSALPAVEGAVSPRLELHAREMSYDPDAIAVEAGNVEVVLYNDGTVLHDLRIGGEPFVLEAAAGQVATSQLPLDPGSYELFCSLPGHRDAGMVGVLEVR